MATFTGSDKAIAFLFDMVANIASDYDETAIYAVNDYAIHEGVLYKCTSAITIAETFTPAHWTAVLVMNEIAAGGGGGGSSTLAGLTDVSLSSVSNGDVLTFDSTLNKWKNSTVGGSGESYSTSEQAIGTWTDGRTVYRRVYQFTPRINLNAQSWYTTPISNTGMSLVLRATIMDLNGTHWEVGASCRTGNYMEFFNLRNGAVNNVEQAIIEYVKTT